MRTDLNILKSGIDLISQLMNSPDCLDLAPSGRFFLENALFGLFRF